MKKIIYRIFFFVSFLPIVALLSYAVYLSIMGIEGYAFMDAADMEYGFDVFKLVLFYSQILFPYTGVIIFICLSYQVAYLYTRKNDNKKPVIITTIAATAFGVFVLIGYYIINPHLFRLFL